MKRIFNKNNIVSIILALLISLSFTWNSYESFNIFKFSVIAIFSFLGIGFIWKRLETKSIDSSKIKKISKKEIIFYAIIILAVLVIGIIGYYPGIMSSDCVEQWQQIHNNIYSNWHPLIHTLFLFKLPTLIYDGVISSCILQVIIIWLILLYFTISLRKNILNFKQTLFVLLLIILNPLFIKYSVNLWKDTLYSWFVFLGTIMLINITIKPDEYLGKLKNKILLIISGLGILLFRHNGLVPFVFMFLALIIFYPKFRKFLSLSFLTLLIFYFVLTGPIYNHFGVKKNGGKTEMVGLVMGNLSYYYNKEAAFTDKELEKLNKVIPLEIMKAFYNPRNFNNTKWMAPNYTNNVKENFNTIMTLWLKKSLQNPLMFTKSFLNMTSPVWQTNYYIVEIDLLPFDYETELTKKGSIKSVSNNVYETIVDYNKSVSESVFRWIFADFGESLLIIVFALALVINKSRLSLKKWIPFGMIILNTLVMMLLITGEEYRFVYSQVICCMPLLIYSLSSYAVDKKESKFEKFLKKVFIKKTDSNLIQLVRYCFVGGIAAVVNIGMLYVFTDMLHIYYIISNVMSFILGLIVNYVLSKKFVFQDSKEIKKSKEFIVYGIIGVLGLIIDTILVALFTSKIHFYYLISKIISTILVFIWNFVARKVFYKIIK